MIVAVATTGPSREDRICRQFAWCHCLVLFDDETGQISGLWSAPGEQYAEHAEYAVRRMQELNVRVVVAGQFCPRTRAALELAGLTCREALGRVASLLHKSKTSQPTKGATRGPGSRRNGR